LCTLCVQAVRDVSLLKGFERMDTVMYSFDRGLSLNAFVLGDVPVTPLNVPLLNVPLKPAKSNLYSLASVWAKRYVSAVSVDSQANDPAIVPLDTAAFFAEFGLQQTAAKLHGLIRQASAQAWAQTEQLLGGELQRHGIAPELVNPWAIAADSYNLFEQAIVAYGAGIAARQTSRLIGHDCGQLRAKYMQADPRLIGFVSMQCHYTGQVLLAALTDRERESFTPYLKVIDDHLSLPLREAYQAAAQHDALSERLRAVQHLLSVSSKIARKVYKRVNGQNPGYQSHSGALSAEAIKVSSLRDIEMFQMYLCVCLLEGNVRSVQEQLFPLCVMLYPQLNVSWQLVQEMLAAMGWEMHKRLLPGDMIQFLPYLRTLGHMFSEDVFCCGGKGC
jgi:Phycobilisome protein